MFLASIKLGVIEINPTFIFQVINTLFLIGLLVSIVFFIKFIINNYNNHKKLKAIENKLKRVEASLESGKNHDQ